jgi:DNA polymerase III alpha subunit (gram-positive type)
MDFTQAKTELYERDLCFIDIETTGSLFGYHEIIEIGAVRTTPKADRQLGEWYRRIVPTKPERVTEFAQNLTNFDAQHWVNAHPSDQYLWEEFARFAAGSVPVCHNPSFDRAFITLAAAGAGVLDLLLDYHWIGTESLAWPLYRTRQVPKLSLAELCRYLGVPQEPLPHNALNGAHACHRVYAELVTRFENFVDERLGELTHR